MGDLGGGTADHVFALLRRWDRRSWDTRIVSEAPLTAKRPPDAPVTYVGVSGRLARFPFAQLTGLARTAAAIRSNRPDLLHCYFFWTIMYGRMLKWTRRIDRLVENREDQGFAWGDLEYALLRKTRHLPDRVICVSEAVRQVAVARERLAPERTVVIHNGVDTNIPAGDHRDAVRRELGYAPDVPLVGMVSNLNRPIKGVRYFLDAIPLITQSVPSARFVIFGGGKDEAMLRGHAASRGIADVVQFAGFRKDIDRYYDAMDVSVLTSLSEGLSIALLDSMNHGLPVVVTAVGGNPEVVVDGTTGYLVPPRDAAAFAQRVIALLGDPGLRERMGRAARERIRSRFDIRQTAQRYLELYREVLGRPGEPRAEISRGAAAP